LTYAYNICIIRRWIVAPTLFRIWNLRVVIYPKDHSPPHVHVIAPDAEAKFDIKTLECLESYGFTEKTLKRIREYLKERKETLLEVWDEYKE
jgi:hypothetical protein